MNYGSPPPVARDATPPPPRVGVPERDAGGGCIAFAPIVRAIPRRSLGPQIANYTTNYTTHFKTPLFVDVFFSM
jgi:hypothetical protein